MEDKVGVVRISRRIPAADLDDLQERLAVMPEVRSVEYVSKSEALRGYREDAPPGTSRT